MLLILLLCTLDFGLWTLDSGLWPLVSGPWLLASADPFVMVRLQRTSCEKMSGVDDGQLVGWPDSDVLPGACDGRGERFNTLGKDWD